jgi:hypothetical protein
LTVLQYGHGLFGNRNEVNAGYLAVSIRASSYSLSVVLHVLDGFEQDDRHTVDVLRADRRACTDAAAARRFPIKQDEAFAHGYVLAAVDWIGLSAFDEPEIIAMLATDITNFRMVRACPCGSSASV